MNIFEKCTLKLTTKSPVHIGSFEQSKTRFEFIIYQNYLYPVSEERLAKFLHSKNLIGDYCARVEAEAHLFSLADFLKSKAITINESLLNELSSGRKIILTADASQMQEYKPLIRDGYGNPYIPGSSIKGVIRTAILYKLLKTLKEQHPDRFTEEIEKRISSDIDKKVNSQMFSDWINIEYFENLMLLSKTKTPHTDWLKMLKVSDAYCHEKVKTILVPANILKKEEIWKYKEEYEGKKTTIWIECIPENTTFEFDINFDKGMLFEFKKQNSNISLPQDLNSIFDCVTEWSQDLIKFEKNFLYSTPLKNWYENNVCNFRIGFGSGMLGTTILMLLNESLRCKIRNYAGIDRGENVAPKSRRIFQKGSFIIPPGWCLLFSG